MRSVHWHPESLIFFDPVNQVKQSRSLTSQCGCVSIVEHSVSMNSCLTRIQFRSRCDALRLLIWIRSMGLVTLEIIRSDKGT